MQITVNGESKMYEHPLTIAELLNQFELHPQRVAVEVNERLVRRADFAGTRIEDGDRIEIVTFVGGG
jgi:sulfur carrier protein